MVPQGYTARLYKHDGFVDGPLEIDGPAWTSNNHYLQNCLDLPSGYDNTTTSIQIVRSRSTQNAIGKWVPIYTTTETFSVRISEGFKTTESESRSESESYTLGFEMNTGIEFENFKVNEEYSYGI